MNSCARVVLNFLSSSVLVYASFISPLYANPEHGTVVSGNVSISQPDAKTVIVNQSSDKAIINWQRFNIAADEHTRFQQPSSSSIILNRVTGGDPSKIFGQLSANGKLVLVNPAGIYFSASSRVNVASIIATTANISNEDFLAGHYHFVQGPGQASSVINDGEIRAAAEGLVALVAPAVANHGLIEANLGRVALASGNEMTVDLYGDQMIHFAVANKVTQAGVDQNGETVKDAVSNKGRIIADGGKILLTANVAQHVVQNVINMEGVAQARSVSQRNGEIILSGGASGTVKVSGKLDVSGQSAGRTGGKVKVLGERIQLTQATVDASGDIGGGEILIGGNYQGQGAEQTAKRTVIDGQSTLNASALTAGNGGRIIVWSEDATDYQGHLAARGGTLSGDGGFAEVSGKAVLNFGGTVDLNAPQGRIGELLLDPADLTIEDNGGTNEYITVDGDTYTGSSTQASILDVGVLVAALANASVTVQTGTTGVGNGDIWVADSITWSSGHGLTLKAYRNITLNAGTVISNTGGAAINLIADATGNGAGTIMGSGTINAPGSPIKFYYNPNNYSAPSDFSSNITAGALTAYMLVNSQTDLQDINQNLNGNYALNKNITLSGNFSPLGTFTGQFDGRNHQLINLQISGIQQTAIGLFEAIDVSGVVENLGIASGMITNNVADYFGAIAGVNYGLIRNVYNAADIVDNNLQTSAISIGGLVGENYGTIENAYNLGNISQEVQVASDSLTAGGIAGFNSGIISNAYNAGAISATANSVGISLSVGAIAGFNTSIGGGAALIEKVYNLGVITGNDNGNQFIGINNGPALTDAYWNVDTAGAYNGNGGVGLTTAQMMTQSSYTGFDFTPGSGVWGIIDGASYPYFQSQFTTAPQIISGTLYTDQGNTAAGAGNKIALALNGALLGNQYTFADGTYYFALPTDTAPNASLLLAYTTGSSPVTATTVALSNGTHITDLDLYGNTLLVSSKNGAAMTVADLVTAQNGLLDPGINYFPLSMGSISLDIGNSLLTDAQTPFIINNGVIFVTNGDIRFRNTVTLTGGSNAALSTSNYGSIIFDGAVNAASSLLVLLSANDIIANNSANDFSAVDLQSASGDVSITDANALYLDNASIVGDLTVNAGGAITQNFGIYVSGTATFSAGNTNDITLGNAGNQFTTVAFLTGRNVNVVNATNINLGASTITGNLTVTASDITINGNLGSSSNRLGSITLNGNVLLNAADYYSAGDQTYNGAVTLGNNVRLDASTGNISFNSTLMGPYDLTLNTPNGDITFVGAAGNSSNRLGALQIVNARNVTEQNVLKVFSFTQLAGSGTTAFGTMDVDATQNVYVNTNYITGLIIAGGSATLIGQSGVDAQVNVGALTLGGLTGSAVTGTVNNQGGSLAASLTSLASGAQGIFRVNGFIVGQTGGSSDGGVDGVNPDIYNILSIYSGTTGDSNSTDDDEFLGALGLVGSERGTADLLIQIDEGSALAFAARAICQ